MLWRRVVTVVGLLTLAVANIVAAPFVQDRFVTDSYLAFSYDSVDGMDPATQQTEWVRRRITSLFGLYLALGEHPGATVLTAPDVVLEPQFLFGFGQADELRTLEGTPSRAASSGCVTERSGEDSRLGPYHLCLERGETIEVFRADDVIVVQDSSVP